MPPGQASHKALKLPATPKQSPQFPNCLESCFSLHTLQLQTFAQSIAQGKGEMEQSSKSRSKSVPIELTSFPAACEEGLGLMLWESQVQETNSFSGGFLTYSCSPAGESQSQGQWREQLLSEHISHYGLNNSPFRRVLGSGV